MWGVQGGHVYISISPSSCNYKQLADTAYPEPFLNYILGGSVSISTCKFKVLAAAKMIDPKNCFTVWQVVSLDQFATLRMPVIVTADQATPLTE